MSQPNFVELAKCGDLHAISVLITRALKSQKITVHASSHGGQLQVLLEAEALPRQVALGKYIYQGITRLNIPLYKSLIIYGKRLSEDKPDWEQEFSLVLQDKSLSPEPSEAESYPQKSLPNNSSSDLSKSVLVGQKQQVHQRESTDRKLDKELSESSTQKNTLESSEKLVCSVKSLQNVSLIVSVLLWVAICFNAFFLLYSLFWIISDGLYTVLNIADTTGLFFSLINQVFQFMYRFWDSFELTDHIISRIFALGLLVWLHCLHTVLKWSFKSYPISPWGAVARYVIPFYNLWGIWNIFSTLANHLVKDRGEAVAHKGEKLKRWLTLLYAGMVLSIVAKVTYYFIASSSGGIDRISWWFYVGSNTISLVNYTLYLQIVNISRQMASKQAYQLIHLPR